MLVLYIILKKIFQLISTSYYLNWCLFIIIYTSVKWNFICNLNIFYQGNTFEIGCKILAILFRPQCLNSLWCDVIWWQRSWSTLTQVMAWCLSAPSHYLNQCWLIINDVFWHSTENNFTGNDYISIPDNSLKITDLRLQPYLPGANALI